MTDHDTGRLVGAGKGRDEATLRRFFDALGEERSALLTHISADGAEWIHTVAAGRAPQVLVCLDAYHVVTSRQRRTGYGTARPVEPTTPRA